VYRYPDRGYEPIAAPWHIDNEPISITSVAQRATQCRDMDGEVCRVDEYVRPNPTHQLFLADQFTGSFKQNNQDFQSATSEGYWLVAFQQKKLFRKQAE
jgi:hypothetical protein